MSCTLFADIRGYPKRISDRAATGMDERTGAAKPGNRNSTPSRYIAAEEIGLYGVAENIAFSESSFPFLNRDDDDWTEEEGTMRILRRFARYNSPFGKDDLTKQYTFNGPKLEKVLAKMIHDGYIHYSEAVCKYFHTTIFDRAARLTLNMAADDIKARDTNVLAILLCDWQKIGDKQLLPRSDCLKSSPNWRIVPSS